MEWVHHTDEVSPHGRERVFAIINNCAMILSIYLSLCPFYFLRMYSYQKYNVKEIYNFDFKKNVF